MQFIWMVVVGFVVGLVARAVMPGTQSFGFLLTAAIGVGGSFLAGFVGQALGWYSAGRSAGLLASVVGAIALMWIVGKVKGNTPPSA